MRFGPGGVCRLGVTVSARITAVCLDSLNTSRLSRTCAPNISRSCETWWFQERQQQQQQQYINQIEVPYLSAPRATRIPVQVVKITDTWEGNPLTLCLKHLVPGFWDIWHQLGSPPTEKQPHRVVKRTLGYVIREYAPRLVTQPSLVDYSNSREVRAEKEGEERERAKEVRANRCEERGRGREQEREGD